MIRGKAYHPRTREHLWSVDGRFVSPPVQDRGGNLYFRTDGNLEARSANRRPLWRHEKSGHQIWGEPVVTDNAVYLLWAPRRSGSFGQPSNAIVEMLDRQSGEPLATSKVLTGVKRGFFRAGEEVFLGLEKGYVRMALTDYDLKQLADRVARDHQAVSIEVGPDELSIGDFTLEIEQ